MSVITELEVAKAGSRKLDAEIGLTVQPDLPEPMGECRAYLKRPDTIDGCEPGTLWLVQRSGLSLRSMMPYTTSIDAALTLRDADKFPICIVQDMGPVMGVSARIAVIDTSGSTPQPITHDGQAKTIPLALCIAALKAREASK